MDYIRFWHTIVELPEYERKASKLLNASEKQAIMKHLATNPQSGALLQGTGGVRKLRWATGGGGKSGGVRVIYYFHNRAVPLFLLTLYGKNEKANLSKLERNKLAGLLRMLVKSYSR